MVKDTEQTWSKGKRERGQRVVTHMSAGSNSNRCGVSILTGPVVGSLAIIPCLCPPSFPLHRYLRSRLQAVTDPAHTTIRGLWVFPRGDLLEIFVACLLSTVPLKSSGFHSLSGVSTHTKPSTSCSQQHCAHLNGHKVTRRKQQVIFSSTTEKSHQDLKVTS